MRSLTFVALLAAAGASARQVEGISFPETVSVGGKQLKLNGAGVRTKTMFKVKVYAAGLYLETPNRSAPAIIKSDEHKRIQLGMLRELSKDQVGEAIRSGFEKNAGPNIATLKTRLDRFVSLMTDAKKGDQLIVTYLPGRGTLIADANGEKATIEGKDFADALFSVWLGQHPVDDDLKKALIAG